jgi:hypothetical protein
MTWRLRVPSVIVVLLVLFAVALAVGANWVEQSSATGDPASFFADFGW